MIKIDNTNLINFYEYYMVAYNGVVHYCQFCPNEDFPDEESMGVFIMQTNYDSEILYSYWEANVVWSLT